MAENESNNLQVAEEPEFTKEIPGIDPEDPVHFAQMNGILEKLLGNDVFLDKLANKMIEKNLIAHVLDCENAQMVLGADQAPVITGLIDGVKEDVTQLYSEMQKKYSFIQIPSSQTYDLNDLPSFSFIRFGFDDRDKIKNRPTDNFVGCCYCFSNIGGRTQFAWQYAENTSSIYMRTIYSSKPAGKWYQFNAI